MNVGIEDFLKEHKTLNVNMNITEGGSAPAMNNKINFDSEKYARHGYLDNTRQVDIICKISSLQDTLCNFTTNPGNSCYQISCLIVFRTIS